MNDDLKHYRAPGLLDWVSEEPALIVLTVLIVCLILDAVAR